MADLGAIGRKSLSAYRLTTRTWVDATKVIRALVTMRPVFGYGPVSSVVSGTVRQDSTLVARVVRVYRRDTGELIASGASGLDGTFSINLNGFRGLVFVIAFDDALSAPDYNAQIYDLVVPV